MKAIAGSRQFFEVKNPAAFNEALYQRALKLAQDRGEFSINTLALAMATDWYIAKALVDRMDREGLVGPADKRGRRKVIVRPPCAHQNKFVQTCNPPIKICQDCGHTTRAGVFIGYHERAKVLA